MLVSYEDPVNPIDHVSLMVQQRASVTFAEASGGVQPYTYDLQCALPSRFGLQFGYPHSVRHPARSLSWSGLHLPGDRQRLSSRQRVAGRRANRRSSRYADVAVPHQDGCGERSSCPSRRGGLQQFFVTLPHAVGRTDPPPDAMPDAMPSYKLLDVHDRPWSSIQATRQLAYRTHRGGPPL